MPDMKPVEGPAHAALELPVSLPARLVGREAALAQIYNQLKDGRPVHLYGAPGSGKTALAATLANAYTQQPGGALWLHVDEPTLDELIVRVGRAYGVAEVANSDTPIGMIGAVENTLKANKPLLVLDGKIGADVASRFVSRCVDGLPVLIVNDERIEGPWAAMALPSLETAGAVALFKQDGRITTGEHDADITALVQLLDHQPFAIVVAARAMIASKQTPGSYLNVLQQVHTTTGGVAHTTALTASARALTGAYQGVLLTLGATFSGTTSTALLSMISGAPEDAVGQALNILAQLNLVGRFRRYETMIYRLHPLAHAFLTDWLSGSNRLAGLQDKVNDSVVTYAKAHSTSDSADYDSLATSMDSLLATAAWAAAQGRSDTANALIVALTEAGDFISERGYRYELMRLRDLATGTGQETAFPAYDPEPVAAPEDLDDFAAYDDDLDDDEDDLDISPEDMLLDDDDMDGDEDEDDDYDPFADDDEDEAPDMPRGAASAPLSDRLFSGIADEIEAEDYREEIPTPRPAAMPAIDLTTADLPALTNALREAKRAGDVEQEIAIQKAIGQQQVAQHMENEAMATYSDLLGLYEQTGDAVGLLETLDMLSALANRTGNDQVAVMHATRGVKLAEDLKDTIQQMHLLTTLGDAHQQLGDSEDAIADYSAALAIARTSNDSQHEALILYKLGYAQLDNGDNESAENTLEQALALFKAQEKRAYEGRVLGALGSVYGDMGRWGEAVNFHTSALYIAREVGDRTEEASQLTSLGYANEEAKDLGQALLRYRQALHLAFERGASDTIVESLVDLARLLLVSKKHLSIAEMLINRAAEFDASDKDVVALRMRINNEKLVAEASGVAMLPVNGTAEQYASNAYMLLDS